MNEIIEKDKIDDLIYEIRGVQVMLDSDFARFYMQTNDKKDINKARNISKFQNDFNF